MDLEFWVIVERSSTLCLRFKTALYVSSRFVANDKHPSNEAKSCAIVRPIVLKCGRNLSLTSIRVDSIPVLFDVAEKGSPGASESLFAALYSELHRLARRELGKQGVPVSLSPTTLLHEAYIDMAARSGPAFPDRPRFMSYASRVMRGLIIDHVRSRHAHKRGGQFELTSLENLNAEPAINEQELKRLSDSLDELAEVEPVLAQVVDLKFFCGFTFGEIAQMRGVTERTVQRYWDKARIYLHRSASEHSLG